MYYTIINNEIYKHYIFHNIHRKIMIGMRVYTQLVQKCFKAGMIYFDRYACKLQIVIVNIIAF